LLIAVLARACCARTLTRQAHRCNNLDDLANVLATCRLTSLDISTNMLSQHGLQYFSSLLCTGTSLLCLRLDFCVGMAFSISLAAGLGRY
jgi:hypothetical protein